MTSTLDLVAGLSHDLDTREADARGWEVRYAGQSPMSFIPPATRAKLGDRLSHLAVNFCALSVDMLAERLRLIGFTVDGKPDLALWDAFNRAGMDSGAGQVHTDALALGTSYVSVWAAAGVPTVLPEHPGQVVVRRDPLTRQPVAALKRWSAEGKAYAVLYQPHVITALVSNASVPDGSTYSIGSIPATGWTVANVLSNPLGMVPVVPFVNAGRLTDPYGVSAMAPIADLNDALQKILVDMMVTSEASAAPRRWATGIEIDVETVENDDGTTTDVVHDPWEGATTTAQSESAESRFGQFTAADLSAYKTAAELLVRQIGALSGLPPQSLGLNADQSMSADAIRAAESTLTAKAEARQAIFGRSWSDVARLMVAIRDNRDPRKISVAPVWADPSTRSESQAADGAAKLYGAGVLSRAGTLARLGYSPEQISQELRSSAQESATMLLAGGTA